MPLYHTPANRMSSSVILLCITSLLRIVRDYLNIKYREHGYREWVEF